MYTEHEASVNALIVKDLIEAKVSPQRIFDGSIVAFKVEGYHLCYSSSQDRFSSQQRCVWGENT